MNMRDEHVYKHHQHKRERARHLRQIQRGQLSGRTGRKLSQLYVSSDKPQQQV